MKSSLALFVGLFFVILPFITLKSFAYEQPSGFELPNTQVHQLTSQSSGRHYEVWIELPSSYGKTNKKLPVLFVSDADYAFPLIRSVRNRLGAGGRNIEDFVIVGLSYAKEDTPANSRNLDYTPTDVLKKANTFTGKAYGGASLYAEYLREQVIPFVLERYMVDSNRKFFVGHSYGALLGSQILLTKPDTFDGYILSSPSLWFDNKYMFQLEQQYAEEHQDLKAEVLLYAGEFEQKKVGPRYWKKTDIVADMLLFEKNLKKRNYQSLKIKSQIMADEDHLSVFPTMISHALLTLLPGDGPYTSG